MWRCLDDQSLVNACRAGQTEAFGALVERYQERLYATILRLIGSAEDAKDVLQDTFLRAYEKLEQFQGESSFYTWVYRIAVNLALSDRRRRRGGTVHYQRADGLGRECEELADTSLDADPTFPLERAERDRAVEAALHQLCPDHRAIVVLKDFDGRRYEEISTILDVPLGTVRSRLHRARCELRERLRGLIDERMAATPASSSAG
jgi:RNA polymerase sigma-70 factor (ECF subfamily)